MNVLLIPGVVFFSNARRPIFVFALAVFLLVFALSLSGVFEIGASLTALGSKSAQEDGYLGSFFRVFLQR